MSKQSYFKVTDVLQELNDLREDGLTKGDLCGLPALDDIFTLKKGYPLFVAGAPFCFGKNQMVVTEFGDKKISDIKEGEKVLSYNLKTKINELKTVTGTSINKENKQIFLEIKMKDGTIIKVTENHLFFNGTSYVKIKDILLSL